MYTLFANPIWFVFLLPLSALVTMLWDWKHSNFFPVRFYWRHWRVFPILAILTFFLGTLIWLVSWWNILQILSHIGAMLIAFAIINIAWIGIQMSRTKGQTR